MARRLVRYYSESGQIPAYAVTSALVPISSNSGGSHFWSSTAITSFRINFIVQAHRVLTDPARSPPSSPVNQATMAQGPLRTVECGFGLTALSSHRFLKNITRRLRALRPAEANPAASRSCSL